MLTWLNWFDMSTPATAIIQWFVHACRLLEHVIFNCNACTRDVRPSSSSAACGGVRAPPAGPACMSWLLRLRVQSGVAVRCGPLHIGSASRTSKGRRRPSYYYFFPLSFFLINICGAPSTKASAVDVTGRANGLYRCLDVFRST